MDNGEKDRAARLLSKEAVPKIDVPRAPPPAVPQFRMPDAISGPVKKAKPEAARPQPQPQPQPQAQPQPQPQPQPKPPPKPKPATTTATSTSTSTSTEPSGRKRRASTGKFKDRTLGWFAVGDQLADAPEGAAEEYAPPPDTGRKATVVAVALAAVATIVLIAVWLAGGW